MSGPVPYRAVRHEPVLVFDWTVQAVEHTVRYTASGDCPVCGCAMTRTFGFGQLLVGKGGFLGRREEPGPGVWNTTCRCESLHMERPAEVPRGCGALLRLAPPPASPAPDGAA